MGVGSGRDIGDVGDVRALPWGHGIGTVQWGHALEWCWKHVILAVLGGMTLEWHGTRMLPCVSSAVGHGIRAGWGVASVWYCGCDMGAVP